MTSPRYLTPEQGYLNRRRGHVPQISISDANHHVTEAIMDVYGDDDASKRDSTASTASHYTSSPPADEVRNGRFSFFDYGLSSGSNELSSPKSRSPDKHTQQTVGSPIEGQRRKSSLHSNHSAHSPPLLTRTNSSDTANQHFPLHDIDYESSPAAVAQELSNLQAIRRMSMNVDAADPDLPSFGPAFSVPTTPPSEKDDDADPARMFWVPARIHPELAPKEFKTFVEDRVDRIRKRSTEGSELSPDGVERTGSNSSLNRRKSMLSRTIDSGIGYEDGADILERKRSRGSQTSLDFPETSLQDLEQKFNDPVELVRKMSIDSTRQSFDSGSDFGPHEDAPILPGAPGGQSLKRSTRTNYRRGSLRKGERVPSSRRAAHKSQEGEDEQTPTNLPISSTAALSPSPEQHIPLSRVQTEPAAQTSGPPDNFSRPSRKGRPNLQPSASFGEVRRSNEQQDRPIESSQSAAPNPLSFRSRIASNGRSTAQSTAQSESQNIPRIVETPPATQFDHRHSAPPQPQQQQHQPLQFQPPERKSSVDYARQNQAQQMAMERSQMRPAFSSNRRPTQTLDDMANNPSMVPGTSMRTDALTFIPSFTDDRDDRRSDKKSKDRRDGDSGSRKGSWGWLRGQDSDKKEKEKERKEEELRKAKMKLKPPAEKPHETTRLDLLSTTSDGPRSRESLVLDRDSIKLDDERRKDGPGRKLGGSESKASGAGGIFSSLFGGGKKKGTELAAKKDVHRRLSPEPTPRLMRADIDYNWTRFSILEERAIYRMAHLKLANPRRALYSQVLLSNFMYSYLAKVQQMHPQIQIPAFVQKQQGNQKSESSKDQPKHSDEYSAWQRYQEQHDRDPSSQQNNGHDGSNHDYDPGQQEQQESGWRHQGQQQQQQQHFREQPYTNSNGAYNHQQQYPPQQDQHYGQKDVYTEQGLFDNSRPPEDDDDLW